MYKEDLKPETNLFFRPIQKGKKKDNFEVGL
jgi:hypothetical protein